MDCIGTARDMKRWLTVALGLSLGLFFAACIFITVAGGWTMLGHGGNLSRFEQIQPGMSTNDVLSIMGHPHSWFNATGIGFNWVYARHTWCGLCVRFDTTGHVIRTDHDH